jgi:hypothetical protein
MVVVRPTYGMVALKQAVVAMAEAMRDEGVDPVKARRAVNRLVWGDPEGPASSSRRSPAELRQLEEIQEELDSQEPEVSIDSKHVAIGATTSTYGHWVEATYCRVSHPYHESGWRPVFGPNLNKERNYQLHEHWIPDADGDGYSRGNV